MLMNNINAYTIKESLQQMAPNKLTQPRENQFIFQAISKQFIIINELFSSQVICEPLVNRHDFLTENMTITR